MPSPIEMKREYADAIKVALRRIAAQMSYAEMPPAWWKEVRYMETVFDVEELASVERLLATIAAQRPSGIGALGRTA